MKRSLWYSHQEGSKQQQGHWEISKKCAIYTVPQGSFGKESIPSWVRLLPNPGSCCLLAIDPQLTHEISLANLDAFHTKNVVRRSGVKIEVRQ